MITSASNHNVCVSISKLLKSKVAKASVTTTIKFVLEFVKDREGHYSLPGIGLIFKNNCF